MARIFPPLSLPLLLFPLVLLGCGGGGGATPTPDAGPPPLDQCVNAVDTPIIAALAPDGGVGDGGLRQELDVYVQPCLSMPGDVCYPLVLDDTATDEDMSACLSDCVSGTPAEGLTGGCMLCYGEAAQCVIDHCILPCLGGDPVACPACIEVACYPRLTACTGIE